MGIDAPLRHCIESRLRMMDDDFESVGIEELELRVRDEAADLEDLISLGVEACHL